VVAQQSLIADLENAITAGSSEQRVNTLRRITDLFLVSADDYSDDQVDVFDDVISRLAEKIETKARAQLARRLAPVARAPINVVRSLASDTSMEVAGPVLAQSPRLTDDDLITFAHDQDRLLAISKRSSLSETVGDMLVTKGNQEVVRSVARNEGAKFSNNGYKTLVDRATGDDDLAVSVGLRADILKEQFQALIAKASEAVFKKLAASNPVAVGEVGRVLFDLTGRKPGADLDRKLDYKLAVEAFDELQRSGRPIEVAVQVFASTGKREETTVALAKLCQIPIETVERVFSNTKSDDDLILLLIKAAGFSWPTAKLILELRRGDAALPHAAIYNAREHFERLQETTARRVIRFYQARQAAR
jgi:hypothetical protein